MRRRARPKNSRQGSEIRILCLNSLRVPRNHSLIDKLYTSYEVVICTTVQTQKSCKVCQNWNDGRCWVYIWPGTRRLLAVVSSKSHAAHVPGHDYWPACARHWHFSLTEGEFLQPRIPLRLANTFSRNQIIDKVPKHRAPVAGSRS